MALRLYDAYARDPLLPRHRLLPAGSSHALPIDRKAYPFQCAFYDAQISFPERFVVALLRDAQSIATQAGFRFDVYTYHKVRMRGRVAEVVKIGAGDDSPVATFAPRALVNATGAWVDWTLRELEIPSRRLIGGTKGSHFITYHQALRQLLGRRGVYTEASDGRPVFILPLGEGVLVGTTDLPFEGDPRDAIATPDELKYLLQAVTGVFPNLGLTSRDIDWHYSGVRPLPFSDAAATAAITRRHWLEAHPASPVPCYSIVGGKLTTCRSLAEQAAATLLERLDLPVVGDSKDRPLPQEAVFGEPFLDGTNVPLAAAQAALREEWASTLDDLVDRRLMLLYQPVLTEKCLRQLGGLLVETGKLSAAQVEGEVSATIKRLQTRHGKQLQRSSIKVPPDASRESNTAPGV